MPLPPVLPNMLGLVPTPVAGHVGQLAFARVIARHPRLLDRLGDHAGQTFAFAPTDLPFAFAVVPRSGAVRAAPRGGLLRFDVRVSGPVVLLLALAEGRVDGDAEFFGRQIVIEGDMEAMLALRNALENEAVDLPHDLAPAGRLARRPVEAVLGRLRSWLLARESRRWS